MTQMNDYTPVKLVPSQRTDTSSPFVAPPFEMAFRRTEKLFWQGLWLQYKVEELQFSDFGPDHNVELALHFFEHRLALCLMVAEFVDAKKILDREIDTMGRPLDSRYTRCIDADCVDGWIQDGAKLNVIKARILLQQLEGLMQTVKTLLKETADSACDARALLTREAEKALSGSTSLRLDQQPSELEF